MDVLSSPITDLSTSLLNSVSTIEGITSGSDCASVTTSQERKPMSSRLLTPSSIPSTSTANAVFFLDINQATTVNPIGYLADVTNRLNDGLHTIKMLKREAQNKSAQNNERDTFALSYYHPGTEPRTDALAMEMVKNNNKEVTQQEEQKMDSGRRLSSSGNFYATSTFLEKMRAKYSDVGTKLEKQNKARRKEENEITTIKKRKTVPIPSQPALRKDDLDGTNSTSKDIPRDGMVNEVKFDFSVKRNILDNNPMTSPCGSVSPFLNTTSSHRGSCFESPITQGSDISSGIGIGGDSFNYMNAFSSTFATVHEESALKKNGDDGTESNSLSISIPDVSLYASSIQKEKEENEKKFKKKSGTINDITPLTRNMNSNGDVPLIKEILCGKGNSEFMLPSMSILTPDDHFGKKVLPNISPLAKKSTSSSSAIGFSMESKDGFTTGNDVSEERTEPTSTTKRQVVINEAANVFISPEKNMLSCSISSISIDGSGKLLPNEADEVNSGVADGNSQGERNMENRGQAEESSLRAHEKGLNKDGEDLSNDDFCYINIEDEMKEYYEKDYANTMIIAPINSCSILKKDINNENYSKNNSKNNNLQNNGEGGKKGTDENHNNNSNNNNKKYNNNKDNCLTLTKQTVTRDPDIELNLSTTRNIESLYDSMWFDLNTGDSAVSVISPENFLSEIQHSDSQNCKVTLYPMSYPQGTSSLSTGSALEEISDINHCLNVNNSTTDYFCSSADISKNFVMNNYNANGENRQEDEGFLCMGALVPTCSSEDIIDSDLFLIENEDNDNFFHRFDNDAVDYGNASASHEEQNSIEVESVNVSASKGPLLLLTNKNIWNVNTDSEDTMSDGIKKKMNKKKRKAADSHQGGLRTHRASTSERSSLETTGLSREENPLQRDMQKVTQQNQALTDKIAAPQRTTNGILETNYDTREATRANNTHSNIPSNANQRLQLRANTDVMSVPLNHMSLKEKKHLEAQVDQLSLTVRELYAALAKEKGVNRCSFGALELAGSFPTFFSEKPQQLGGATPFKITKQDVESLIASQKLKLIRSHELKIQKVQKGYSCKLSSEVQKIREAYEKKATTIKSKVESELLELVTLRKSHEEQGKTIETLKDDKIKLLEAKIIMEEQLAWCTDELMQVQEKASSFEEARNEEMSRLRTALETLKEKYEARFQAVKEQIIEKKQDELDFLQRQNNILRNEYQEKKSWMSKTMKQCSDVFAALHKIIVDAMCYREAMLLREEEERLTLQAAFFINKPKRVFSVRVGQSKPLSSINTNNNSRSGTTGKLMAEVEVKRAARKSTSAPNAANKDFNKDECKAKMKLTSKSRISIGATSREVIMSHSESNNDDFFLPLRSPSETRSVSSVSFERKEVKNTPLGNSPFLIEDELYQSYAVARGENSGPSPLKKRLTRRAIHDLVDFSNTSVLNGTGSRRSISVMTEGVPPLSFSPSTLKGTVTSNSEGVTYNNASYAYRTGPHMASSLSSVDDLIDQGANVYPHGLGTLARGCGMSCHFNNNNEKVSRDYHNPDNNTYENSNSNNKTDINISRDSHSLYNANNKNNHNRVVNLQRRTNTVGSHNAATAPTVLKYVLDPVVLCNESW